MKLNENTTIKGSKVILVPYDKHLVEKYHSWMQDDELLKLTASERLTLDEEYNMQKSWRDDEDKCTFIVLDSSIYNDKKNEIDSMIGDINLFVDKDTSSAEVSLMIAEKIARSKGLGTETLMMMLWYGIEELGIKKYFAKISQDNEHSVNFFKRNGFQIEGINDVFKEVTMVRTVDENLGKAIETQFKLSICKHREDSLIK